MVKVHSHLVLYGNYANSIFKKESERLMMKSQLNGETVKFQLNIKSRTSKTSQSEIVNSFSTLLKRFTLVQSISVKFQLEIHKKNKFLKSTTQSLLLVNLVVKLSLFGNILMKLIQDSSLNYQLSFIILKRIPLNIDLYMNKCYISYSFFLLFFYLHIYCFDIISMNIIFRMNIFE